MDLEANIPAGWCQFNRGGTAADTELSDGKKLLPI